MSKLLPACEHHEDAQHILSAEGTSEGQLQTYLDLASSSIPPWLISVRATVSSSNYEHPYELRPADSVRAADTALTSFCSSLVPHQVCRCLAGCAMR